MNDMSPLAALILHAIRWGAYVCAGLVALILGIELWRSTQAISAGAPPQGSYGFWILLVVLIVGCLWLARSIGRHLRG